MATLGSLRCEFIENTSATPSWPAVLVVARLGFLGVLLEDVEHSSYGDLVHRIAVHQYTSWTFVVFNLGFKVYVSSVRLGRPARRVVAYRRRDASFAFFPAAMRQCSAWLTFTASRFGYLMES